MTNTCLRTVAIASGLLVSNFSNHAAAFVVVAEDFLYDEVTVTETSFSGGNKFDIEDFGGGLNGPGGLWGGRWFGIGSGLINGDDVLIDPFVSNPHTGSVTGENSAQNNISRPYTLDASVTDAQPLWFSGRFRATDTASVDPMFAELGIFSAAGVTDDSLVSIGLQDNTFFGTVGGTTVLGDPTTNAADDTNTDSYRLVVGQLELNAAGNNVAADYNGNGINDAADYTIWRDNLGIDDGTATFGQGDGTGDGNVDQADYDLWAGNFQAVNDRLTVYLDPTAEGVSDASVLVVEDNFAGSYADNTALAIFNGGIAENTGRRHFLDDLVIGTTFDDVASVEIARLTLEVDPSTGEAALVNNSSEAIDIAFYEISSESGSLDAASWNSLDDQGVDSNGWLENSADDALLIESNLGGATEIAAGGELSLGAIFDTTGSQDLVASAGVLEGPEGLLNVVDVQFTAASVAVPEPGSVSLLAILAACGLASRKRA